ncbi:MAG: DUF5668 domain-containing protein [Patescibacteria group bacterium]
MKIIGIALVFVGVVALLKDMGFIVDFGWNTVWPLLLIILGLGLKYMGHHGRGSCGSCKGGSCDSENTCSSCGGSECGSCKK